jgi:hypothetical protein
MNKEEPKQIKCYCGHTITCDCEPKQETLEEAAENAFNDFKRENPIVPQKHILPYKFPYKLGFIEGYKLAQQRMYSEEDLLSAFEAGMMFIGEDKGSFREWFEQFKKNGGDK